MMGINDNVVSGEVATQRDRFGRNMTGGNIITQSIVNGTPAMRASTKASRVIS
jgi:hypothetical protein